MERIKDEYLPAFFQTISDYLAKNGIATLYYDSRGTGKSSGNFSQSTPLELSGDLSVWHDLLIERPDIIPNQIGIIGHSEGGMIAAMAVGKLNCFNQIILLGAPGLPIRKVFEKQCQLMLEAGEISGEKYEHQKKIDQKIYKLIGQKATPKAITDSIKRYIESLKKSNIKDSDDSRVKIATDSLVNLTITWKTSPHYLFNLQANPADYIEKVTCPVLSLNGSNDRQVTPKDNQEAIRQALIRANNKDYKIIELQGLNHSFQECEKGTLSEALKIDPSVSPKALEIITNWILEHTKEQKNK